ncbi:MAG: ATP-binding protein [Akkermansiaceae bacterium]|nr:ATP-binding protein [Armatimonadota bacterium]
MQFTLTLSLPEDLSHVALVRHLSRDVLGAFKVFPQDVDDIETLVGELATNAVCHAQGTVFGVEITLSDDMATVKVTDSGVGFTRDRVLPPGTPRTHEGNGERIGGWGIPMVEMLADRVDYQPNFPHGTIVRVEKLLQHG